MVSLGGSDAVVRKRTLVVNALDAVARKRALVVNASDVGFD